MNDSSPVGYYEGGYKAGVESRQKEIDKLKAEKAELEEEVRTLRINWPAEVEQPD